MPRYSQIDTPATLIRRNFADLAGVTSGAHYQNYTHGESSEFRNFRYNATPRHVTRASGIGVFVLLQSVVNYIGGDIFAGKLRVRVGATGDKPRERAHDSA